MNNKKKEDLIETLKMYLYLAAALTALCLIGFGFRHFYPYTKSEAESLIDDAYNDGFNAGYMSGDSAGRSTGYDEGYADGHAERTDDLQREHWLQGWASGYDYGYADAQDGSPYVDGQGDDLCPY